MKATNSASALLGAAALALVLLTVSAAQRTSVVSANSLCPRQPKPVRIDIDLPLGTGPINTLMYTVPIGKTLLLEGYSGHADGPGELMREAYSGGGLGNVWRLNPVINSTAGDNGEIFNSPITFKQGESLWWNHINPGNPQLIHMSFTGYLVDA